MIAVDEMRYKRYRPRADESVALKASRKIV
jgi:hypothetical protein